MMEIVNSAKVKKGTAYAVHFFTALGAGLGLWAIILIINGNYQHALWALAAAAVIDSVDGPIARKVDIKFWAHKIDGSLLDNIIDYLNWSIAPLFWVYMTVGIPSWVILICAVLSALGFSNTQAKTSDNYFKGFPNYWNFVALYLYLLNFSPILSSAIMLILAAAIFLPVKFIHPSRTENMKPLTLTLGGIFAIQLVLLLILFDEASPILVYTSLLFPAYYFLLSFYLNIRGIKT